MRPSSGDALAEPIAAPTAPEAAPTAPPTPSFARVVLLRLEAAAFLTLALMAVIFWVRLPLSLPSEDDYRAAAQDIGSRAAQGDAVLLDPHWAERARLFLQGTPVLNLARKPVREDLRGYGHVFLLSLPDLPRSDQAGAFTFLESIKFRRAEEPRRHGRLTVTLFENTELERPTFDFTSEVAGAQVYIRRPDGSREICPAMGGRHPCPRAGWINVGEEIKEIDSKPFRCLWAHPAGSEPLVVEYPDAPLGKTLDVVGGIVGQIVYRHESYGTLTLTVKIDGNLAASVEFPPGVPGERRRAIDTSAQAGGRHLVQFEVSAPNPDMRHFCFAAEAYP